METNIMEVREYTALALMGTFTAAMISLIVWSFRKVVGRGLASFNGIRNAIEKLTMATLDNTEALEIHRVESIAAVERLSREIRDIKGSG